MVSALQSQVTDGSLSIDLHEKHYNTSIKENKKKMLFTRTFHQYQGRKAPVLKQKEKANTCKPVQQSTRWRQTAKKDYEIKCRADTGFKNQ
jgi:hypothetical protein